MSHPTESQASGEPVRKRPRTRTTSHSSTLPAFSHDGEFWYDDGNVILVAQDVGFRVYKGWLSAQSEIFRDMFNLPQPTPSTSQDDVFDGCPIVHVTDTVAEIRSLLAVLFSGRQCVYIRRVALKFDDIANCVRLAHKYGIQDLLEDSLEELKRYFPESFDAWDCRLKCNDPADAIVAVNLARLTNTESILPAALYSCCQLDGDDILEGRVRGDGVIETLSSEDLARCFDGKAKLCTRHMRHSFESIGALDNPHCKMADDHCRVAILKLQSFILRTSLECGDADVLGPWDGFIKAQDPKVKPRPAWPICSSCITALRKREKIARIKVWSELPELLDLDEDDEEEGSGAEEEGNEGEEN
ncbi:uncharacterized protein B0H18DRAFT_933897 [Fomitopsis serialis]|uniref:uncharacterized protein n=1 Tax=Fomitopsis serialis TaxID=139415 RepID=UPI0020073C0F|nr:uncharacterized protein B0H18DRAFT_933897 [Neoantrodia serialis]KAH9925145.1 hypothetical protein B0H18DRAFT_933897 [Neoantrodia serialis]